MVSATARGGERWRSQPPRSKLERRQSGKASSPGLRGPRCFLRAQKTGRSGRRVRTGEVFVVAVGPSFELLARNEMGAPCMATPALSGELLLVRTTEALYAIGRE